ncbi:MAG: hypothetical protein WBP45_10015 [Daejeonella sp.]
MNTLSFKKAIRQGDNKGKTERHFLDFMISGKSLKTILGLEDSDMITSFGWTDDEKQIKQIKNSFKLQGNPELKTKRVSLYVCPECGDIGCGAITASIKGVANSIIWEDFGYENGFEEMELYTNIKPIEFNKESYLQAFSEF